ncbi:hypothetical protein V1511DRAFT_496641 [Dipodascopsis uninucleata]
MSPHSLTEPEMQAKVLEDFRKDAMNSLKDIVSGVEKATKEISDILNGEDLNELASNADRVPGISLLNAKAEIMASYLGDMTLRMLSATSALAARKEQERQVEGGEKDEVPPIEIEREDDIRKLIIVNRVFLERGIKPLEKKIDYQIHKLIRAGNTVLEKKTKISKSKSSKNTSDTDDSNDEQDDSDSGEDEEIPLSFKPRPNMLVSVEKESNEAKTENSKSKYIPPKINPTKLPSTNTMNGPTDSKVKTTRRKRNQALEEYIEQTTSMIPEAAPSVGSNVLQHGRGGTRTAKEQVKEDRVRNYEESNFIRLQEMGKKQKKRRARDEFMGENWDFGIGDYGSTKKKKKSLWDRNK